jgi:hypothetical protein
MKKVKKLLKNSVDGEVLHFIVLRGKMEFEFAKNARKNLNFVFVLEKKFNFETLV